MTLNIKADKTWQQLKVKPRKKQRQPAQRVKPKPQLPEQKNFILDTNVILHDFKCLDNFEENDIYIPFVVLEELDKFKKRKRTDQFQCTCICARIGSYNR